MRLPWQRRHVFAELEPSTPLPTDVAEDHALIEQAMPFTMTGPARLQATIDAARYCVAAEVPGAFAECGVWRGGSVLAMILILQESGRDDKDIWLYDTFEGMTEPTEYDVSAFDRPAQKRWEQDSGRPWPTLFGSETFNEEGVRELLIGTGYPEEQLHFVRGPVEQTIPDEAPEHLALLRLDTDWYESTRHELEHLFPRLVPGGVLILDDYGHWDGARKAVDEFFVANPPGRFSPGLTIRGASPSRAREARRFDSSMPARLRPFRHSLRHGMACVVAHANLRSEIAASRIGGGSTGTWPRYRRVHPASDRWPGARGP